ncbi:MAG: acyl-CoA desaturase [Planctomycetota bacterium]|jgi:stearoyl-CoA desaturase (delta-9 desaturase)
MNLNETNVDTALHGRWHWTNISLMASMHLLALLVLLPSLFHWSGLVVLVVMFFLAGCLGVCLGYHRLLTHRSLRTSKVVEYALTVLGTMSFQGSPMQWVGTHRIHHRESDGPNDPHSPQHGFTWSHVLWCFFKHPDGEQPLAYTMDMQRDRGHSLIDRFFYVPQIVLGAGLFGAGWVVLGSWQGGLCWMIWGVPVRTVLMYHATWFVNSAAHTWGYRNFETADGSKNNWWVALISFGEGWHNNHHAQQRSAAHGMRWWELDPTYWVILVMEKVGLAERVVRPKPPRS